MNKHPLKPITQDHIEAYNRDGVVLLQGMIDQDWVERITEAWLRMRRNIEASKPAYHLPQWMLDKDPRLTKEMKAANSGETRKERMGAGFFGGKFMHLWDEDFMAYGTDSPAGEMVGRVLDSETVRYYWDQMFCKDAGCTIPTYWHADYPAWPCGGEMLPSLWLALTPTERGVSSLEFIAGTHKKKVLQWPRSFNARAMERPEDRPDFIDYEEHRDDPDIKFLSFDMEPGDAVLIHPRVYHGAGANNHPSQDRIALTTRWFGDDVVWDPRPECVNTPGLPYEEMTPGAHPDNDDLFPIAWRREALAA